MDLIRLIRTIGITSKTISDNKHRDITEVADEVYKGIKLAIIVVIIGIIGSLYLCWRILLWIANS